jgi:outer membrane protein OmpA-like peptidoglycan-associated protein
LTGLAPKHTKFLILTKSKSSIMAINLLDLVQGQLGGAAMSQIGKFLGEDSSKASAGMAAALPAILGSVMQKGSTESGAKGIMDLLSSGGHDGSMFDNLGSMLGGGNSTNNMMNTGGTLLNFFMGDKTQAITDLLIKTTGLGKGTMGSVLRMAAPMLIGMIGKQVGKSGLNAGGLMSLLGGQKDFVKAALPAGMGSLLGFSDMGDAVKETASRAATTTKTANEGKSMLSRVLPLALIAALAFAGYKYFTSGNNVIADAAETAMDKTADAANAVGDAAGDAASVVAATAAGSAGENMYKLLDAGDAAVGKSVVFKNLNFKSGSAEIDPATAIEVEHLAQVLKAYPNVKVEIGGHTDNVGDAQKNQALSENRAAAVAKMLVRSGGLDQSRVSTFGFGAGKPIGDNKTEAGRAMNRRIEVTIVK